MRIVGRDREIAALSQAVRDTRAGSGRLMLLRGEAGIGKSTLAAHVLDLARADGLTVLHGQAHPLHAGLAYAPIVEAFRPYGGHTNPRLARLLAPQPSDNPDLERTRMFEAMREFVEQLAPAVLMVDDLHWADRGTVELVHYIGQDARGVLVLGAYRPVEAGTPVGDLGLTVRRADPAAEITLTPLADQQVAELTSALLGREPDGAFLAGVTTRAKGVPLFVTALVHEGFRAGAALPAIVRDVVLGRLHALDERPRRLLEIVAVAGEAGIDEVLRDVYGSPGFESALKALVVGGLVTEHVAGRTLAYRVGHPLYAEVAYAELTLGERRQLHASMVTAIEKVSPDDVLALAPHYREAGSLVDSARAARIMADAGWRALAMRAADEAVRYLEVAATQAEPDQVPALLEGVGRAQQAASRFDEAAEAWTRAIDLAQRHGQDDLLGELRFRMALLDAERYDSDAVNERVVATATAITDQSLEAAVQAFVFTIRHTNVDKAREITRRLAGFVETDPSPAGQAVGYLGRSALLLFDQRLAEALSYAEVSIAHADQCAREQPFFAHYTRMIASGSYMLFGDMPRSAELASQLVEDEVHVDAPSMRTWEYHIAGFTHYLIGDIHAASRAIDTGHAIARRAGLPRSMARTRAVQAFLLAEQGRLAEAKAMLTEAREMYLSPEQSLHNVTEMANAAIALQERRGGTSTRLTFYSLFNDPCSATLRALFTGLAAARAGDVELLADTEATLRIGVTQPPLLIACADRLRGLRLRDAALLAEVADRFDTIGCPLLAAQCRLEGAEAGGDRDAVVRALVVFERSGTSSWADRARQLARSLGVRPRTVRSDGVLTKRETEVVRLLGEGLSNSDIAARLFLSERTVETHLRNSYAKLGLTSRVALARWADENVSPS
ncbi:ATP-binding protein [Kibdelosporangium phytohabitans]|uniref:HTH luxR-type domain-containing protein n=1 Tax=Kibdelosporangium phytohabitans TaxID=860235 RepID=A0A0N9HY66_9PSEU|nr:helix-turn-helix transcriptional regulator [Kibdelosporangium phytohabitans]ALG10412.1 hypothetical protein AOZ06_29110 [Kibdelosporangium phytohabitans]MBE1461477.1 DNA-binding CsgD family transcriptional regulator/tetratricopeptide (TPR) repeat protein [Kibdelosporangium phytohabitans]